MTMHIFDTLNAQLIIFYCLQILALVITFHIFPPKTIPNLLCLCRHAKKYSYFALEHLQTKNNSRWIMINSLLFCLVSSCDLPILILHKNTF